MDNVVRFKKQKALAEKVEKRHGMTLVVDSAKVEKFLQMEVDVSAVQLTNSTLSEHYHFNPNVHVTD